MSKSDKELAVELTCALITSTVGTNAGKSLTKEAIVKVVEFFTNELTKIE
jgi:hypothetical protein